MTFPRQSLIPSPGAIPPVASPAPSSADRFTIRELIAEAQREAFLRRRVYAKRVRAGQMDPRDADRQIDLMEAIVRRLTRTAHL